MSLFRPIDELCIEKDTTRARTRKQCATLLMFNRFKEIPVCRFLMNPMIERVAAVVGVRG